MRRGETPVPIPNTTVKPRAAENTTLATAWEDKWMPDIFMECSSLEERLSETGGEGSIPLSPFAALPREHFDN